MRLRRDGLTWQAIGDDIVVLDLQGSVYLRLNGTGRVLWEALAGDASVDEMIERIVAEYDVALDIARTDVEAFVEELRRRELVQPG